MFSIEIFALLHKIATRRADRAAPHTIVPEMAPVCGTSFSFLAPGQILSLAAASDLRTHADVALAEPTLR